MKMKKLSIPTALLYVNGRPENYKWWRKGSLISSSWKWLWKYFGIFFILLTSRETFCCCWYENLREKERSVHTARSGCLETEAALYVVAMGDGTEDTSFEIYANEELGSWQVVTSGKVRADMRIEKRENRKSMKGWSDPIQCSVLRFVNAEYIYTV